MIELQTCPRCGSHDLRIPALGEDAIPETGHFAEWTCGDCGLSTNPLAVHDDAAYRSFVQAYTDSDS